MTEGIGTTGTAGDALLELAIDGWRIARLFSRVLNDFDGGDGARYANQVRYFARRVEDSLAAAGLRIVDLEGQPYDTGLPVTALNIADFAAADSLYVSQMLDPVVMGPQGVIRTGTIMLARGQP